MVVGELSSLQGMVDLPPVEIIIDVLQKCKKERKQVYAKQAYEIVVNTGLETHALLGNYIVPMLVECGCLVGAQQTFNRLTNRNEHSWASLLQGYITCEEFHHARIVYQNMEKSFATLNKFTIIVLLRSCSRFKCVEIGMELHSKVNKVGYVGDLMIGSALVDMYFKCGLLAQALGVFNELPYRDVVLWTALIAGYVEHGWGREALLCLEQMGIEGICPDATALICSLKACRSIGNINIGLEIHADIVKRGFEISPMVGNCLVDLYSKCGSIQEARQVFFQLPHRNVVSWNALIGGLAEHQLGQEALDCFQMMQWDGLSPDATTYICSMKACRCIAAINEGRKIHQELIREGFEKDIVVGSTLVDMYAKCGSLPEAQDVLDELLGRNTVSWNALIGGYAEHGPAEEVTNCFEQMQREGVQSSAATYVSRLRAFGKLRDIERGLEVHAEISRDGFVTDPFVNTALVDMYVKCGAFARAWEAFNILSVQDSVSWTALMTGYAEHGFHEAAVNCFQQMQLEGVLPDSVTYVCVLKTCGNMGAADMGREIHADITKKGIESIATIGHAVVNMYMTLGLIVEAQEMFDTHLIQTVVSWTQLIAGYTEHGLGNKALACFQEMQLKGICSDPVIYCAVLKACGSLGYVDKGRELHSELVKVGFEMEPPVSTTLVDMYSKCGSITEGQEVFDKIAYRDAILWTTLIAGYMENGLNEEAWNIFQRMQLNDVLADGVLWNALMSGYAGEGESGKIRQVFAQMMVNGSLPDYSVFLSILKVCGNALAMDLGKEVHARIPKFGHSSNEVCMSMALIEMYDKCGSMSDAQGVFDMMVTKDIVAWNALLTGYTHQGEAEIVFALLKQLQCEGLCPDEITFLDALNVCSHEGLVDGGLRYLKKMVRGCSPTMIHFNSLIDLFGRAGCLDAAVGIIKMMPFEPDIITWSILLGTCQKWCNVEVGRRAFESAVLLNTNHAASFILMSNIHADAR